MLTVDRRSAQEHFAGRIEDWNEKNTPASMMLPSDTDQKACAHTNGLLMTGHEVVVVSRFQIPTKAVFAIGPEHEVSGDLTRD